MGTYTRFNYTMMGDNVNLAARLEKGTRSWGVWTLCTNATWRACDGARPGYILFRRLGRIVVVGRAEPIELLEPVEFETEAGDQLRDCLALFERGVARMHDHDWAGAIQEFDRSAALERERPGAGSEAAINPSIVFLHMAQEFQRNGGPGPQFFG